MMDVASEWQDRLPPFCAFLRIRLRSATPEGVSAEMEVRPELCLNSGRAHGGALMAFADTLGGLGAVLNLPAGAATTTIESKTNFFAPASAGTILVGTSEPLHRGRRTSVWQTRLTDADGRLIAQIIQTQLVLDPGPTPS